MTSDTIGGAFGPPHADEEWRTIGDDLDHHAREYGEDDACWLIDLRTRVRRKLPRLVPRMTRTDLDDVPF